ncbi:hypothetical protein J31TS6_40620 [Brevibacillus reuszeri]|nr:DUF771 domain-containing protein [Brevibacillus reuszeri]GIO08034.1 hypothetical protein J31TS6_40620 [Brevibacillus reuszeri]
MAASGQSNLLRVEINEIEFRELCIERISELVKESEAEYVFWDTTELKKRTCMSWNTIQDTFFHDPRFVKRKVGSKWYFPARETRAFLEQLLHDQPH